MSNYPIIRKSSIRRILVSNFKSFRDLDLQLDKFNVLIGSNSSGKSSFVQIFQFLKDVVEYGLDNAVSLQGGVEFLRNVSIGAASNLKIEIILDSHISVDIPRFMIVKDSARISVQITEATYKFSLKFFKRRRGFEVEEDVLRYKATFSIAGKSRDEPGTTGNGDIVISNNGGIVTTSFNFPPDFPIQNKDLRTVYFRKVKLPAKTLLLQTALSVSILRPLSLGLGGWQNLIDISLYDFDPRLSKRAVQITGKAELESDGRNLAIVLKNVTENSLNKRKFSNLIQDLLPFISNIRVQGLVDRSILFNVKEKYYPKQYLPSSLISDGTITVAALILALYFDNKKLTILEEPERNLHPYLIARIVNMMKDASSNKQIIITTHNPELVRHAGVEHILLVSRDKDGFSKVTRPAEKEHVRAFLREEMDLGELYVQNLLGV